MEKYQPENWQLAGGLPNKIHLTEACDDDAPRLITHVATTSAPVVDAAALPVVHQALKGRDLLPVVQPVDSGYLDAPQIVAAREDHALALCGPARPDDQWQARAQNGFALDDFRLDWEREQATCPTGQVSISWRRRPDPAGRELIWVTFSSRDCGHARVGRRAVAHRAAPPAGHSACARARNSRPCAPPASARRPTISARRMRSASGSRAPSPAASAAAACGARATEGSRRSTSATSSPRLVSTSSAAASGSPTRRAVTRAAPPSPACSPSHRPPARIEGRHNIRQHSQK